MADNPPQILLISPTHIGSTIIPDQEEFFNQAREKSYLFAEYYQKVATDWPLIIEDHHYRKHRIILNPGEVLFYESARLKHGRPIPLKGQEYANIFCHFKIAGK